MVGVLIMLTVNDLIAHAIGAQADHAVRLEERQGMLRHFPHHTLRNAPRSNAGKVWNSRSLTPAATVCVDIDFFQD